MTSTDNRDDVHLLVGAYVLDAVDDVERARFTRHLTSCQPCQQEVAELSEAVGLMAAQDHLTPPDRLRRAALQGASETVQLPPPAQPSSPHHRRRLSATLILGAASVLLFVAGIGLGTMVVVERGHVDQMNEQASMLTAVLTAPDAHMKPIPMGSHGSGTLVTAPGMGSALVAADVPAPPPGQVYQLWTVTTDGSMTSAGTWTPSPTGTVAVSVHPNMQQAHALAVTMEPTGGSAQPTSPPIAEVQL